MGRKTNQTHFKKNNTALPVVLVTGCSSGIGFELAKLLSKLPYRLVITARQSSLQRLKKEFRENAKLWIRPLDITTLDQIHDLVNEINQKWGGVDILVNNAGISYRAMVEDMSAHDESLQMQTNYLGPMNLIRAVLPTMRRRQSGQIINISSVSGMMAMPTMASYSASKFALEGATEALWYEMKPWNIKVSLIQPGFINSEAYQHVYYSSKYMSQEYRSPYFHVYRHMTAFVEKMMRHSWSSSADIADLIVKTIRQKNPALRIPATLDAHVFFLLRRLLPRKLYHRVLFACLPGVRHWKQVEASRPNATQRLNPSTRLQAESISTMGQGHLRD